MHARVHQLADDGAILGDERLDADVSAFMHGSPARIIDPARLHLNKNTDEPGWQGHYDEGRVPGQ
jgi:hypothetical protein